MSNFTNVIIIILRKFENVLYETHGTPIHEKFTQVLKYFHKSVYISLLFRILFLIFHTIFHL